MNFIQKMMTSIRFFLIFKKIMYKQYKLFFFFNNCIFFSDIFPKKKKQMYQTIMYEI